MVPKRLFFTKGVGKHKERLTSFELALRDAGIAAQNLVRVSSIFPPNAKLVTRKEGLTYLSPGEVVFAVVAENSTREPHRLVASSIGVAIPSDRNTYGYLSEHHSFGETEEQTLIPTKAGTKRRRSIGFPTKSSARRMLPSRRLAINVDCGRPRLRRQS
jgi:arginine decarboxylase